MLLIHLRPRIQSIEEPLALLGRSRASRPQPIRDVGIERRGLREPLPYAVPRAVRALAEILGNLDRTVFHQIQPVDLAELLSESSPLVFGARSLERSRVI